MEHVNHTSPCMFLTAWALNNSKQFMQMFITFMETFIYYSGFSRGTGLLEWTCLLKWDLLDCLRYTSGSSVMAFTH